MLDGRVKLVAISHVPTNGGLVNPVEQIGAITRQAGVLYLVDACQSVGQMPVRVDGIQCDFLSVTGRKFVRGPRGTGLLYVRRSALEKVEPPFLDLHAAEWVDRHRYVVRNDARRFETWEGNVAGRVGLGVALEYCRQWGIDAIWTRVQALADTLRKALAASPGVTVTDLGGRRCGIVTFTVDGRTSEEVKRALRARDINVSVSDRASTLLDMQARGLDRLVRASVHYYNDEHEINALVEAVQDIGR
jgi:selenocysteine lyase/cysteine desulfurase